MAERWKRLSFWKGISDFVVLLILMGMLTGIMGEEFYNYAAYLLIPGLIATLMFLIKQITK